MTPHRQSLVIYAVPPDSLSTLDGYMLAARMGVENVVWGWKEGDSFPAWNALILTSEPLERIEAIAVKSASMRAVGKVAFNEIPA